VTRGMPWSRAHALVQAGGMAVVIASCGGKSTSDWTSSSSSAALAPAASTGASCSEGGILHASGTNWECGCNICSCSDGVVTQTAHYCGTTTTLSPPVMSTTLGPTDAASLSDASAATDGGVGANDVGAPVDEPSGE